MLTYSMHHLFDNGALAGFACAEQEDLDDLALHRPISAQVTVDGGVALALGGARPAPHVFALCCGINV